MGKIVGTTAATNISPKAIYGDMASTGGMEVTVYGNKEVRITDNIAPIEHVVRVKLHSTNLLPKFTTQSKNGVNMLVGADGTVNLNGYCTENTCFSYYITCERDGLYCIRDFASGVFCDNDEHVCDEKPRFEVWNSTQKTGYKTYIGTQFDDQVSFMLNKGDRLKVGIWVYKNHSYTNVKLKPAMYYGVSSIDEYYQYKDNFSGIELRRFVAGDNSTETVFVAEQDGTVNGVKSVYPTMVLRTSYSSVAIEATYLVDAKYYIDKKFDELATML